MFRFAPLTHHPQHVEQQGAVGGEEGGGGGPPHLHGPLQQDDEEEGEPGEGGGVGVELPGVPEGDQAEEEAGAPHPPLTTERT